MQCCVFSFYSSVGYFLVEVFPIVRERHQRQDGTRLGSWDKLFTSESANATFCRKETGELMHCCAFDAKANACMTKKCNL